MLCSRTLAQTCPGPREDFPSEELGRHIPFHLELGLFLPCASSSACPRWLWPARMMTNFLPSLVPSTPQNIHVHLEFLTTKYFSANQNTVKQDQPSQPSILPAPGRAAALHPGLGRLPLSPAWLCRCPLVCTSLSLIRSMVCGLLTSHFQRNQRQAQTGLGWKGP